MTCIAPIHGVGGTFVQVRYLDSREDEARRMITIASSCVTLLDDEGHLFNLVIGDATVVSRSQ